MRASLWLLATIVATATCLEITCSYNVEFWENMGQVYTCNVVNLTIKAAGEKVTDVLGEHLPGKLNKDVLKLNIANQVCYYLPSGFEKFFPNLEGLRVATSNLIELKQSDISIYPKLRNCDMFNNRLEVLPRNLFFKNPELEYLYFGDNRIQTVGYNLLKPLTKIHKAVFQGNACIHKNANSVREIAEFQQALNEKCSTFSEEDARKLDEYEEEIHRSSGLSSGFLWTFGLLSVIVVFVVAAFILKKRRESKIRGDTDSVTGILPPYNEMYREPSAPYASEAYENGSTNLMFNNQRSQQNV